MKQNKPYRKYVEVGRDGDSRQLKVRIPNVPNFVEVDGVMRDLTYFDSEELHQISNAWKTNLYQNELRQRKGSYDK